MKDGPSLQVRARAAVPLRQVRGATMTGAPLNVPSCFPFLKAGKEGPPVHAGGPFSFSFLGLLSSLVAGLFTSVAGFEIGGGLFCGNKDSFLSFYSAGTCRDGT